MNSWIRLEVIAFSRRPGVRWMLLFWPLLIFAASWSTELYHRTISSATDALRAEESTYYETLIQTAVKLESGVIAPDSLLWHQTPTNPLVSGLFRASGHHAIKPVSSSRWLAIGFADVQPPAYQVKMGRVMPPSSISLENPLNQALGRFDTAFLLVFLLPLFCITLAYDILSKDRQLGLMDLTRAYGQPIWKVAMARGIIHVLFWVGTTLTSLLIAAVWISEIQLQEWLPLMGALTLYILFFVGISVVLNLKSDSPIRNGLQMVSIWLLFLILIPSLANAWLQAAYPPPSRSMDVAAHRSAEVSSEQAVGSPAATAGWHEYWTTEFLRRQRTDRLHRIETERTDRNLEYRHQISHRIEWFSPALWFQSQLLNTAGVSASQYSEFRKSVHIFEKRWTAHFMGAFQAERLLTLDELGNRPSFDQP